MITVHNWEGWELMASLLTQLSELHLNDVSGMSIWILEGESTKHAGHFMLLILYTHPPTWSNRVSSDVLMLGCLIMDGLVGEGVRGVRASKVTYSICCWRVNHVTTRTPNDFKWVQNENRETPDDCEESTQPQGHHKKQTIISKDTQNYKNHTFNNKKLSMWGSFSWIAEVETFHLWLSPIGLIIHPCAMNRMMNSHEDWNIWH